MKELIINGKRLTTDFDSYIATRLLSDPPKKIVKESVPFSNVVYDFSNVDGAAYYEERELTYVIDIAETDGASMEEKREALINWLASVFENDIYDPYLNGKHLRGSYSGSKWSEDFGAGELEVTFTCYPYKLADEPTTANYDAGTITINNDSAHPVIPTITASEATNITINGNTYAIGAGTFNDERLTLAVGANTWTITAGITVSYVKEVL